MLPLVTFAGGAFAMFTLNALESIEHERKYKETVMELQNQRATVTSMGQQIAWQNHEIILARERVEKAEKAAAARSWNDGVAIAVGAVAVATIGAMVHEMR